MSDPVADFLAREQDALAELEGSAPTSDPDVSGEDTPSLNGVPDLDGGVAGLAIGGRDSGVDLEALGGGSNFNDDFASAPPLTNGSSSKGPSPVPTIPRIEPETIRIWRENQKIVLEKKDADEEKKKEEWKKAAKKELDDWYAQRTAQLNSTKNANRKAEDEAAADRAKGSGQGAEWEQIARLCEAPKGSKNTKDTSRLKSLLLHLKNVKKQ